MVSYVKWWRKTQVIQIELDIRQTSHWSRIQTSLGQESARFVVGVCEKNFRVDDQHVEVFIRWWWTYSHSEKSKLPKNQSREF